MKTIICILAVSITAIVGMFIFSHPGEAHETTIVANVGIVALVFLVVVAIILQIFLDND